MSKKIRCMLIFAVFVLAGCTKAIIDEETAGSSHIDRIIKYDPDVADITFNHCTACHGGPAPSAGLDLTTYHLLREAAETGNLLARIQNEENPMPPSGLLSAENRQILLKWAEDGYLEN